MDNREFWKKSPKYPISINFTIPKTTIILDTSSVSVYTWIKTWSLLWKSGSFWIPIREQWRLPGKRRPPYPETERPDEIHEHVWIKWKCKRGCKFVCTPFRTRGSTRRRESVPCLLVRATVCSFRVFAPTAATPFRRSFSRGPFVPRLFLFQPRSPRLLFLQSYPFPIPEKGRRRRRREFVPPSVKSVKTFHSLKRWYVRNSRGKRIIRHEGRYH